MKEDLKFFQSIRGMPIDDKVDSNKSQRQHMDLSG